VSEKKKKKKKKKKGKPTAAATTQQTIESIHTRYFTIHFNHAGEYFAGC
jgi:hypothetical protein